MVRKAVTLQRASSSVLQTAPLKIGGTQPPGDESTGLPCWGARGKGAGGSRPLGGAGGLQLPGSSDSCPPVRGSVSGCSWPGALLRLPSSPRSQARRPPLLPATHFPARQLPGAWCYARRGALESKAALRPCARRSRGASRTEGHSKSFTNTHASRAQMGGPRGAPPAALVVTPIATPTMGLTREPSRNGSVQTRPHACPNGLRLPLG